MIDDNFNNPVTAYLKGKAIQEKKTPIPDRIRDQNVCSYCHSSTVHTVTHHCAQMERPLTRQDVLDIGAWFNDEKRMNIGRDVQGKALSLVGDNLRLRDELDHESAAAKEHAGKYFDAMHIIQALRHKEAEFDALFTTMMDSDTNQLRQERDALRLRIKAVDQEHSQLKEDRKKMIVAYTEVETDRNFWKHEHAELVKVIQAFQREKDLGGPIDTAMLILALKKQQQQEREAFQEEMKRGFSDLLRIEKQRDQYKRLWELRGRALARPCAGCGYVQEEIKSQ